MIKMAITSTQKFLMLMIKFTGLSLGVYINKLFAHAHARVLIRE